MKRAAFRMSAQKADRQLLGSGERQAEPYGQPTSRRIGQFQSSAMGVRDRLDEREAAASLFFTDDPEPVEIHHSEFYVLSTYDMPVMGATLPCQS